MSQTIDSKVLEMQFDNSQFEKNVQTSLSTLDRLKQALNLEGATKGLSGIGDKIKNINTSGLSSAVDTVSNKFSALEVIGITALANITNEALNAGKKLISSLSVDNIVAGWSKFGEKTNSVATLVSQGYELEKVNGLLDKLNWYTDETSYNFTDMVQNIAKFTATGQDLDSSVTAMEGIANWAALSGQNATKASMAMYQLSQAMSKGALKYDDWKSIQNASMDTVEFREHALEAAEALGVVRKEADDTFTILETGKKFTMSEMFTSDALSRNAWFTSDVMMDVFNQYSSAVDQIYEFSEAMDLTATEILSARKAYDEGKEAFNEFYDTLDRSDISKKELKEFVGSLDEFGVKALLSAQQARTFSDVIDATQDEVSTAWMKTFEILIGNYEEATAFYTDLANELYDVFAEPINDLNNLLEEVFGEMGGRELLVESFWNIWNAVLDTMSLVGEAWRDVFPTASAEQLFSAVEKLRDFTAGLTLSDDIADKLSRSLKGVFSALDIVINGVSTFASEIFNSLSPGLGGLLSGFLGLTASAGDWLVQLDENIKESQVFEQVVSKISVVISKAGEYLSKMTPYMEKFYNNVVRDFTVKSWDLFVSILDRIKKRFDGLSTIMTGISKVFFKILELVSSIGRAIADAGIFDTLYKFGSWLINSLGGALDYIIDRISNADFKGIFDFINGLISAIIGLNVAQFVKNVDGGFGKIIEMITSFKDTGGIKKNIEGIFGSLADALQPLQESLKADTLLKIAKAIALLAGSLFLLSLIDSTKLTGALGAISVLFAELIGSMGALSVLTSGRKMSGVVGTMLAMSVAVLVLASALKKISSLDPEALLNGIAGIGSLLGELILAVAALNANSGNLGKGAGQLILVAVAIRILTDSCVALSQLNMDRLISGLSGVGVLLAELSLFVSATKFGDKAISGSLGLLILSAAIMVLVKAVEALGNMDENQLVIGIGAVGALLTELAAFTRLSDKSNLLTAGVGMIAVATAMKILADVISDIGQMPLENVIVGLIAIGGALTAVAIAVNALPKDNLIKIGLSMLMLSGAIAIIAHSLESLSKMSEKEMITGLVSLGGALVAIAVATNAMKGALSGAAAIAIVSASLLLLAPALKMLGSMSLTNIFQALIALAGAFAVLGTAAYVLAPVLPVVIGLAGSLALIGTAVALFGVGLLAAGAGLSSFAVGLSLLAVSIGSSLKAIIGALIESATEIGTLFVVLLDTACDVLSEMAPKLIDTLLTLIVQALEALAENAPKMVSALLKLISSVIDELIARIPEIIGKVGELIGAIFSTIIDAISGFGVDGILKALESVGIIALFMGALSFLATLAPSAMVGVLALGGLIAELGVVFAALGTLKQIPGLEWIIGEGSDFANKIGNAIGSFVGNIIGGIGEGASASLPAIGENLSSFYTSAQPFFEGMKGFDDSVFSSIDSLAGAILKLTAADLIDGIASFITGGASITSFAEQLPILGEALTSFADNLGDNLEDTSKIEAASNLASMLAALAKNEIPTTGGVLGWLAGQKDLGSFGEQITAFGKGLSSFAYSIGDNITPDKIKITEDAGQMLVALSQASAGLDNGGIFTFGTLEKFGWNLESFGISLAAFFTNLSNIDTAQVSSVMASLQGITDTISIIGQIDTSSLSSFMQTLQDAMNIDLSVFVDNITNSVGEIQNAAQEVVNAFSISLQSKSAEAAAAADSLVSNVYSAITSKISSFVSVGAEILNAIGLGISESAGGVTDGVSSVIGQVIVTIGGRASDLSTSGKFLMTSLDSGMDSMKSSIISTVSNMLALIILTVKSNTGNFRSSGATLAEALLAGLSSKNSLIKTAFNSSLSGAASNARGYYTSMYNAGAYIGEGLAKGIESKIARVKAAARNLSNAGKSTTESDNGIDSPSKVYYGYGEYIGEGLALGILSKMQRVSDATSELSKNSQDILSSSIVRINDYLENGIDDPQIRPVLDLSNIESGVGEIGNMLDLTPSVGLMNGLGAIDFRMQQRNERATNDDVVNAIKGLSRLLKNVGHDTYNINGITYDDGSNIVGAVKQLVRAARMERRA